MATFSNNLGAKKGKKVPKFYVCNICDYKCCKKYSWDRHLMTAKHINLVNGNESATNKGQKGQIFDNYFSNRCVQSGKKFVLNKNIAFSNGIHQG